MTRFNATTKQSNVTTNHEGAKAYKLTPELELYSLVCTFALQNKFYESSNDQMARLTGIMKKCDHEFIAKLAVYAREEMYLRTVPLILTVELAKIHSGDNLISKLVQRIVQRADEVTELLAFYQVANQRTGTKKLNKLSNQIKKGIRGIFESGKFTEYNYGKYNRKTEVTFRDALFLTHPKPQDKNQKELFDKITNNTLEVPYTWETEMSKAGQADTEGTTKKKVWEDLIDSGKMGYMAILRNLRNFLQNDVSQAHIMKVCEKLADPNQVRRSKQLPFRFLSAYRMLSDVGMPNRFSYGFDYETHQEVVSPYTGRILEALEKAVITSTENIPGFDGQRVLIATDVSASMIQPVSPKSVITCYDIGTMLAMLLHNVCDSVAGMFGDTWKPVNFPKSDVLRNTNEIYRREGEVGYSTNGYKVLLWANKNQKKFDKVMIFTDCQLYDGDLVREWNAFKSNNPGCKMYLFDTSGYGSSPLNTKDNDVYTISGWSDKIFNVLSNLESGGNTLDEVSKIKL